MYLEAYSYICISARICTLATWYGEDSAHLHQCKSLASVLFAKFACRSPASAPPESFESFIDDQAFSSSYDLAPPPILSPLLSVSSCKATHWNAETERQLAHERGGAGGWGTSQSDDGGEKAWSSVNHSILTAHHRQRILKVNFWGFLQHFIQHCFICRAAPQIPRMCLRMLGSNQGLRHWLSDALIPHLRQTSSTDRDFFHLAGHLLIVTWRSTL